MAVQQIKLNPEFEHLSQAIRRVRGQSTVYIDERGYNYYHHSIRRDIRLVEKWLISLCLRDYYLYTYHCHYNS